MSVPRVTFKHGGASLASSRYRSIMPARWLQEHGIEEGTDWLVIGKHGWNWGRQTEGFKRVCFDICDDHFGDKWGQHYREGVGRADLVTCNSEEMRRVIMRETGHEAVMIPDPYEQPEREPRVSDRLLWFGHASNLPDLEPWAYLAESHPLEIVTNARGQSFTQWTAEAMDEAFDRAGLVLIPTGKSMAKSGNRAIESLRRGLFVVAGYLPAYADLGIYVGDIGDGVDWALTHRDEVLQRIKSAQAYIANEYSIERIGALWKRALSS